MQRYLDSLGHMVANNISGKGKEFLVPGFICDPGGAE
jgi:hypothetical protein